MEGKDKKIEGEDLNNQEKPNGGNDETNVNREEKYKKFQSDSEKGVQKLLSEKKQIEEYHLNFRKEVGKIAKDPSRLVEVYDDNPKMAQEILEEYYDGIDLDEFISEYLPEGKRPAKKVDYNKLKEKAKAEAKREVEAEEANSYFESKIKGFDKDQIEAIKEEWEELVGGRHINRDFVKKRLPRIIDKYDKGSKGDDADIDIIKTTSPSMSGFSKSTSEEAKKQQYREFYSKNIAPLKPKPKK